MPRKRKQLLLKLGVFLLLGAIVNVAVAWGIASDSPGKVPPIARDRIDHGAVYALSDDATFEIGYFGTPCEAMMCSFHAVDEVQHGIHLNTVNGHFVFALPLLPIWPGFAINTIFYAGMLWLLWIARRTPGKIRWFIRVSRGRCPACGFIIAPGTAAASGGPCSECGAASPATDA